MTGSETALRISQACADLGLPVATANALRDRLLTDLFPPADTAPPSVTPADVIRMLVTEAEMMSLLKTPTPDKLVHDLRNLMNEVALLKAVVAIDD